MTDAKSKQKKSIFIVNVELQLTVHVFTPDRLKETSFDIDYCKN